MTHLPDTHQSAAATGDPSVDRQSGADVIDIIGEPIPAPVREAMALFGGPLDGITFPDVDAARLGALADDVRQRAREAVRARAALDEARSKLDASQAHLLERVRKGIAYARVYALDDEKIAERLEALALVKADRAARKPAKRRRRARKSDGKSGSDAAAIELDALPLLASGG